MSANDQRLKIVLCWHMHQPYYLDPVHQRYVLPWTYLHAIKDYVDMVWHLEQCEGAKAVVNFTPTLLDQIDDYASNISSYLRFIPNKWISVGPRLKDPLLATLVKKRIKSVDDRKNIVHACLRANQDRLINRFEHYRQLADFGRILLAHPEYLQHVNDNYFSDLVVWYHIAWLGESVKRTNRFVQGLMAKRTGFSYQERVGLLQLIGELVGSIVKRYKKLHQQGRVELSVTPYGHPIMPLLLDLKSAREAWPDVELPSMVAYPGGYERSLWHIRQGIKTFEKRFGFRPEGCWPGEGSVNDQTLELLHEAGFKWTATGENVLKNSVNLDANKHLGPEYSTHGIYQFRDGINCFFRDDGLSDEIGFTYSDWHADDAVANLIHHLQNIRAAQQNNHNALVSIILDGENAWEYYPENGYYFLSALYKRLSEHPDLRLATFSECLREKQNIKTYTLNRITAGSWVYGTFSTWIGHRDKNRAWELLIEAKKTYDKVLASRKINLSKLRRLEKQLAICEASDWFWWFGDDNPGVSVKDFDMLYRMQLEYLYKLLSQVAPDSLAEPVSRGGGDALHGGVMKPGKV